MAFRTLSTLQDLAGFYLREKGNILEGFITKYVPKKGGPFFIIQLTSPLQGANARRGSRLAKAGDHVGLAASVALKMLNDYIEKKIRVRVEYTNSTPSKQYEGKMVPLFNVAADDGPEVD